MSLLSLFDWLAATRVGLWVRDSSWAFAAIETVHLLALAALGATVLALTLRLFGVALKDISITRTAREVAPWFAASLATLIASGILLASGEARKCYFHPAFRWKMALLAAAISIGAALLRQLRVAEPTRFARIAGGVHLALWFGVALAGRLVGLL